MFAFLGSWAALAICEFPFALIWAYAFHRSPVNWDNQATFCSRCTASKVTVTWQDPANGCRLELLMCLPSCCLSRNPQHQSLHLNWTTAFTNSVPQEALLKGAPFHKEKEEPYWFVCFFSTLAISNRDLRSWCLNVNSDETKLNRALWGKRTGCPVVWFPKRRF